MTKTVRNRKNRADIAVEMIQAIEALDTLTIESITHIINAKMSTSGTSNQREPKEVNGVLHYYCSRSDKFYPIEEMVVNTDGSSRGYSRVSQEILTATNKEIKDLTERIKDAVTEGNFADAKQISEGLAELEANKASNAIYQ